MYHLLSAKEAYNETVFHRCNEEALKRAQFRLRKQAAQPGFQVILVKEFGDGDSNRPLPVRVPVLGDGDPVVHGI